MTKEDQITAYVVAIAKSNNFDESQFDLLMHVAVISKYIADGVVVWDEENKNLTKIPPRNKMH